MIDIKFDSVNEKVFVDHLKSMLSESPIILQNIIEPAINGLISDSNVPQVIAALTHAEFEKYKTENPLAEQFKTEIKQVVDQAFDDESVASVESAIGDHLDSEKFTDVVKEIIGDSIDSSDIERRIGEEVDRAVEHVVDERYITTNVDEAIGEMIDDAHIDILMATTEIISEKITDAHIDIPEAFTDNISERINDAHIDISAVIEAEVEERVDIVLKESIKSQIDKGVTNRICEIFHEMFESEETQDCLNKLVTNGVKKELNDRALAADEECSPDPKVYGLHPSLPERSDYKDAGIKLDAIIFPRIMDAGAPVAPFTEADTDKMIRDLEEDSEIDISKIQPKEKVKGWIHDDRVPVTTPSEETGGLIVDRIDQIGLPKGFDIPINDNREQDTIIYNPKSNPELIRLVLERFVRQGMIELRKK